jgi:hypothetical protein
LRTMNRTGSMKYIATATAWTMRVLGGIVCGE